MTGSNDILRTTAARLKGVLGDFALPAAERLLEHVLHCSRGDLYLGRVAAPDAEQLLRIDRIVKRCMLHEPLDYVLGSTFFYRREFSVTPSVLLPRPDTEVLVERVLAAERASDELLFADIGTGSGIIACTLAEERPRWRGVAVDCSVAALWVARGNLRTGRVSLLCADLLGAFTPATRFDVIVSNPPYIPSATIGSLDRSVREFEPVGALDGGGDGLDCYRRFASEVPRCLKPGGRCYFEIGYDQEAALQALFSVYPWKQFHCTRDLGGHPRVVSCVLAGENPE